VYYSTIILSNIDLKVLPKKDEAAWPEKAVPATIGLTLAGTSSKRKLATSRWASNKETN
jgi:hypothetical protein